MALVDDRRVEGLICATAATRLHDVGARVLGRRAVREHLHTLLGVFAVASVDRDVVRRALDANGFSDYEDAVVREAAHSAGCTALVTRDATGFVKATMPVFQPIELLAVVAARADRFDGGAPRSLVRKRAEIVQNQVRADHHDQHGT